MRDLEPRVTKRFEQALEKRGSSSIEPASHPPARVKMMLIDDWCLDGVVLPEVAER
jgi:hypothetical protein